MRIWKIGEKRKEWGEGGLPLVKSHLDSGGVNGRTDGFVPLKSEELRDVLCESVKIFKEKCWKSCGKMFKLCEKMFYSDYSVGFGL